MQISEPMTLFTIAEDEIQNARELRERPMKADPSHMHKLDNAFNAAVGTARAMLRYLRDASRNTGGMRQGGELERMQARLGSRVPFYADGTMSAGIGTHVQRAASITRTTQFPRSDRPRLIATVVRY